MDMTLISKRARVSAAALVILAAVALVLYPRLDPGWRHQVRGVDVSHSQGAIDWPALAAGGTQFAYIKATEGADWTDARFDTNWRAAGEAGVLRGAYHFFTLCTPGAEQAAHFLATIPVDEPMLPPAIDLEFGGNCPARPPADQLRAELDDFLTAVGSALGARPVAYVTPDFYDRYLAARPPDVHWWVRSPILQPHGAPAWTFWQYFPGVRRGVDGHVDRNVFNGTLDELTAMVVRPAAAPPGTGPVAAGSTAG